MTIKIIDIAFWIIIFLIIALAIWKLFGSPTDTASLIALALLNPIEKQIKWQT